MKNKFFNLMILFLVLMNISYFSSAQEHDHNKALIPIQQEDGEILHYTCGMHPSVRVSVESYDNGEKKCPICFMPLTPVKKTSISAESPLEENIISRVEVKLQELKLAGVKTEEVSRRQLYKEIRAVGRVAYDPQLAIAQDEFISAVKSYQKAKEGLVPEITYRAQSLIESSRRKLLLLGLNAQQIQELEENQEVQTNLILPGDKMWIYGDIYEYELNWVNQGAFVKVKPVGWTGKEFFGEIVSLNPVVDPQTRSVRFRALVDNAERKLKPEMYVDIEITSQYKDEQGRQDVLSIPKSALLDTGRRRIVWVDKGNGQFEGRRVEIGPESIGHSNDLEKYYPVLQGLNEGEWVVTKGNFLIDSQSQITGVAASSYSGVLEAGEEKGSMKGSHGAH